MKRVGFLFGLGFGFFITAGQFNQYNVIHNALRLQDYYVFAVMGSAVLTAMPILFLLRRRNWVTPFGGPLAIQPSKIERKFVYGGLVFGTGWAVAGTCPAPALAMIGSGGVLGILVVAGIFSGLRLRDAVVERGRAEPAAGPERRSAPTHGSTRAVAQLDL